MNESDLRYRIAVMDGLIVPVVMWYLRSSLKLIDN